MVLVAKLFSLFQVFQNCFRDQKVTDLGVLVEVIFEFYLPLDLLLVPLPFLASLLDNFR